LFSILKNKFEVNKSDGYSSVIEVYIFSRKKTLIDNLINCSDLSFALQGICNNLVDQLCNGIDICDPEEFDERNSLEVAASDLVFVCPMIAYGKVGKALI
jgi:hypothetical protein